MGLEDHGVRAIQVNAFVSTDLDSILRARKIEEVILLGFGMET
jgi:nicotinamidase-related amidase